MSRVRHYGQRGIQRGGERLGAGDRGGQILCADQDHGGNVGQRRRTCGQIGEADGLGRQRIGFGGRAQQHGAQAVRAGHVHERGRHPAGHDRIGDGPDALRPHQRRPVQPALRGRDGHGRVDEHERCNPVRRTVRHRLRHHATQADAGDIGAVDVQRIQHGQHVRCQIGHRERPGRCLA